MRDNVLDLVHKHYATHPLFTLLGDLGVYQCRDIFSYYPERILNFGIMEQSMVSVAAGLSNAGLYPVLYSITPFIVDRCIEQIKVDLCYNNNPSLIVSAGASYDYSKLGPTHFCCHDISFLRSVGVPFIHIPYTIDQALEATSSAIQERRLAYLRLSSSLIDPCTLFGVHTLISTPGQDSSISQFYRNSNKTHSLAIIFSPDSQYLPSFASSVDRSDVLIFSMLTTYSPLDIFCNYASYAEIHLYVPFDPAPVIDYLSPIFPLVKGSMTLHSIRHSYLDSSSTKEALFSRFYYSQVLQP